MASRTPKIHVTVLKFFICPKSIKFETLIICKITSSKCLRMHYFNTIFEKFPGPPQINSSLRSSVRCFAPLFSVNFILPLWHPCNVEVTITAISWFCFIARTLDSSKSENTPPNSLSHSSYKKMGLAGLLVVAQPFIFFSLIGGAYLCA